MTVADPPHQAKTSTNAPSHRLRGDMNTFKLLFTVLAFNGPIIAVVAFLPVVIGYGNGLGGAGSEPSFRGRPGGGYAGSGRKPSVHGCPKAAFVSPSETPGGDAESTFVDVPENSKRAERTRCGCGRLVD